MKRSGGSKPKRRRGWRLVVAVVAAAAAMIVLGTFVVYGTSAFAVENVAVRGATFVDEKQIRDAAAIAPGSAIASVDTETAEHKVSGIAAVDTASVVRDWPHTVVITITERKALLAVALNEKFTLVDDAGVAFRTVAKQPADTVKATVSDPGRDDPATQAVLKVLDSLSQRLDKQLVSVEAPAPSRVELTLKGSRTVFWGDSTDSHRKAEVATALLDRSEKHLDVSAPDVPTVS